MAIGFGDKLKTLFSQLFQTVFIVAMALIFFMDRRCFAIYVYGC
jgi:hypothetical protein